MRGSVLASMVVIMIFLSCTSNPSGEESTQTTSDSLNFSEIVGSWEGGGQYEDPENDPYVSDSVFVTHFEITKEKSVSGDSIGVMKWNNKDEYCNSPIYSFSANENTYEVHIYPQSTSTCDGGGTIGLTLNHKESQSEEWIEWQGGSVSDGTLYRK